MTEATERETKSYKEREVARAEKFVTAMMRLHDAAEAQKLPQKALDLIEAAATAVTALNAKLLTSMPADFRPPAGQGSKAPEVGDVVSPNEEARAIGLYGKQLNEVVVKEVVRYGGREDGKGAKIFLKVKLADGTVNTVPASHFE